MEHLHHFGLRQDPFQNEPDLRFYFDSVSHAEPQRRVERGLRQYKGLSVMVGEAGTGKTLLSRRLLDTLEEELFEAQLMVILPGASDANWVLKRYSRMLGVEEPSEDRPGLLAQIYERLAIVREEGRHSVLILDDCHLLDRGAMAEIGGLLNLEYEDRRLISLLLIGLPSIDVSLSHEPSLGQRVDIRTCLQPLDFRNTAAYLLHRITVVGGGAELLPEEALNSLFKYGRGRPRLLNTLADNALFEAYLRGSTTVAGADVERAAGDLGIGSEPGETFTAPSASLAAPAEPIISIAPPPAMAAPEPARPEAPVQAITALTDPGFDSGASMSFGVHDDGLDPGDSALGLGDILDESVGGPITELTDAIPIDADLEQSGGEELSEAVEAVLEEEVRISDEARAVLAQVDRDHDGQLPSFEACNSAEDGANAEATRIAFPEESLTSATDDDALDDLFVELIDD